MDLDQFISQMGESNSAAGDVVSAVAALSRKAKVFLQDKGIVAATESLSGVLDPSNSFSIESLATLDDVAIAGLIEDANIPESCRVAAAQEIAIILGRAAVSGGNSATILSEHLHVLSNDDSAQRNVIGFENILPMVVQQEYKAGMAGMEMFGVNTNQLTADLVTSITVSLMKWHSLISTRMMPTIPSANPLVQYKRPEYMVYDLSDSENEVFPVLELNTDPSRVANELKKIEVIASGNADISVDGYLPLDKDINILAVSTIAGKVGYTTFNRTDLVADDIKLETVQITLDDSSTVETFNITIPASRGRLHRVPNAKSTVRSTSVVYTVALDINTLQSDGGASAHLTTILGATGEVINLTLRLTPTVDIATGISSVYGSYTIAYAMPNGDDAVTTSDMSSVDVAILGVAIDARYNEENYRKAAIVATQEVRSLQFEVPPGRAYGADRSHAADSSGSEQQLQVANLRRLAAIGQDIVALNSINGFMDTVKDETAAYAIDSKNNQRPGTNYPAGGMVNPCIIEKVLDFASIDTFDDGHLVDAVSSRVAVIFNAAVSDMLTISHLRTQMAPGSKLVMRCLCSGEVLSKIVSLGARAVEASDEIEYAMELSDGTILEFVTTTFQQIGSDILMVPFISGAPTSPLNFGHNRSCGTIVAAFDATSDTASHKRLMATVREIPIPTNIVGVRISVTGITGATFGV